MSRARRQQRDVTDALHKTIEVPMDAESPVLLDDAQPKSQIKKYNFTIPTERGPASLDIAEDLMKVCPCGCKHFRIANLVTFIKPKGLVNAEPVPLRVEVYLCDKCGRELSPDDKTVRTLKADAAIKNGAATFRNTPEKRDAVPDAAAGDGDARAGS